MTQIVEVPLWLFILILLFAAVTALSHLLLPSVRWFFRRRLERAVAQLNKRLVRPIEPFRLTRRHDMIQRLSYDPEVTREIVNYAHDNGVPENVGFQKAQEYAREIVPSFSAFAYFGFGIRVAKILARSVYRIRTAERNNEILAQIPHDSTVIFIMNHRSNMDYVLVPYLAAKSAAMSFAVGEWARVWPLSRLIRWWGAYFIRRRSNGNLYRKVLARYVQMATAGGLTQAVFPEGGLSLTGALQPAKMGLLSYVIEGFDPDGDRDVVFVPVAINYDRVLEDRVLIAAHARGNRRFGARISVIVGFIIRKLGERARGADTRFGTAAVQFGAPLSLRAQRDPTDVVEITRALSAGIEVAMPVLAVPLICTALRREGPMAPGALRKAVETVIAKVPHQNLALNPDKLDTELTRACEHMRRHGMIHQQDGVWRINTGQEDVAHFYANSIAHFLPEDAATAKVISAPAGS